ncbi:MAG: aminopeptidase P family protein [Eubacteriales bacterium]|nr:aminopeptidase P family protein [Eubacteriales bacterium]
MKERLIKIQSLLNDTEAALVTGDISITYLTGFPHSEGYVLVTKKNCSLLVDFRYIEAAENTVTHMSVVSFTNPFDKINEILVNDGVENLIIETDAVTLSTYEDYKKNIKANVVCDDKLSKLISELRIVKSSIEVEKLKTAQKIAEEAYLEVLNFIKVGVTEKEIAARLEYLMKLKGAEKVAFDLITVTGKKTSLPHGVPSDNKVQSGDFITFDIGAVYDSYHSDMTRTVAIGSICDKQREIYDIVLKAHYTGLEAVRAGVSGFDVDKASRDVIREAGYGECFGHSTGHGVGLEIHEAPYASMKSKDILKAGMTLTVEPGIYLPGQFGVRIEDTVLVTENGYETFASMPKELIIL